MCSCVFANGPLNWSSIPVRALTMTQKMVIYGALLSTQHYKVRIKSKAEKPSEWRSDLPYTSM